VALTLLFPDSRAAELDLEREVVGPDVTLLNPRQNLFDAIDASAWASAEGIVVSRIPIDAAKVPLLKRARIVVRNGVGFEIIDLKACGEAGIAVCNVPDYGTTEVADSAIAMMLAFARGIGVYDAALRAGRTCTTSRRGGCAARRSG
jgi:lactate dehydrogenase-like 2-hydroxyacid dehydrogenase